MNTPKTIYLQIAGVSGDATTSNLDQATWCDDRVYDDDIEYIQKSDHDAEVASLREQLHRIECELHRYQPAGSPPPGDLPILAAWVLQMLAERAEATNKDATLRQSVRWFAEQMELKLRANDHKGGWSKCTVIYLLSRLKEEVTELDKALDFPVDFYAAISEAADVANFAMMLADNVHRVRTGGKG